MNIHSGWTVGFCAQVPRSRAVWDCICSLNASILCFIHINKLTQPVISIFSLFLFYMFKDSVLEKKIIFQYRASGHGAVFKLKAD